MDWQLTTTLGAVALAAGYLAWFGWRRWQRRNRGCGGSCGCTKAAAPGVAAPTLIPPEKLEIRRRR